MADVAPPMHPGNVKINLAERMGTLMIDDYNLGQFISAFRLKFDSKTRQPVLELELLPSAVDVTASKVEMNGEFRDFLIKHGWRPPG